MRFFLWAKSSTSVLQTTYLFSSGSLLLSLLEEILINLSVSLIHEFFLHMGVDSSVFFFSSRFDLLVKGRLRVSTLTGSLSDGMSRPKALGGVLCREGGRIRLGVEIGRF